MLFSSNNYLIFVILFKQLLQYNIKSAYES